MDPHAGRSLTRQEFDAVIRRATELSVLDPDSGGGALSEAELYRIAGDVGIEERHVRRALTEVRAGPEPHGLLEKAFGPAVIRGVREVPGTPEELSRRLDEFFVATQLLQPVRRGPTVLQYRPAVDWASQIARAASGYSRKYYIASAKSVELRLDAAGEGRTLVEIMVDPGTRGDNVAGALVGGGTAGVASGAAAGWGLALVAPIGVAVGAGVFAMAAVATGITWAVGSSHRKKVLEVQDEVEGLLDVLETGRSLEPPPSSWRRWVKRHFHGVAKDLIPDEDV